MKKEIKVRPIHEIANEIYQSWKSPHYGANPYLEAMFSLNKVSDKFGFDDGRSIVNYFLCNASSWKGEDARRIKKELRTLVRLG